MKAFIKHISTYFPEKSLSNEEISERFPEWDSEKIIQKIGVRNRFRASEDEFVSDMATKVSEKLFSENNFDRSSVDFVLLCTQSPDYYLPTTACIVQNNLGLRNDIGALDFNQGCSGFVYGLSLAKGLIVAGIAKNVLLITAETYTKHIHKEDKGNLSIFGDAAAATIISTDGLYEINEFSLGTDGSGAQNLIVKNGGIKNPKTDDSLIDSGNYLFMDGTAVFNFTIQNVPILVNENLTKNNLDIKDVDQFIFHQANTFMLNYLRKRIGIEPEKFIIDMENCGNTVSSTIPIVLKNLIENKNNKEKILITGFGVGYSWGATVLTQSND